MGDVTTTSLRVLEEVLAQQDDLISRGEFERLSREDVALALVPMLFELTRRTGQKLVQVRDYDEIAEKGPFKYAGQIETMHSEGLMPEDVYTGLKELGRDSHVGPSYLRVKGLLTWMRPREFFGNQMAYEIASYLEKRPLYKKDGVIAFIPNMTGGAYIGDQTLRDSERIGLGYPIWPVTAYARDMRFGLKKVIDDTATVTYGERVEGIVPAPADTAAVICFEELRTACETTKNATDVHRVLGKYNDENGVRIIEAAVFDYRHEVGVKRLEMLGVDALYLVDGRTFFDVAHKQGYITGAQFKTAIDWLDDPWTFTRKILPKMKQDVKK